MSFISNLASKGKNPLYANGMLMGIALVFLLPLYFLDERMILSVPIWTKPIKFSISVALYSFTLVWILQISGLSNKSAHRLSWILTVTSLLEIVCIYLQSGRGIESHFNVSTPLNGFIFSLMGISITIFWIAHLLIAVLVIRKSGIHPLLRESLVWGLGIAAYGMILGFVMTEPRPEQIAEMQKGIFTASGGHTFGGADGGQGISFFGWSKVAGDMRVPHFFGMHAMQFFSVLAWIFSMREGYKKNLSDIVSLRLFGISYLSTTILMQIQALAGESLFVPSFKFQIAYSTSLSLSILGIILIVSNFKLKKQISKPGEVL
ncbi:hypothetical protein [Leptospira ilyithenensis]|uniref:Uncharacterized protein n=1 Tax=Leptospira ilyithenensis TaxID=2484901 RepID=A0A4R9LVY9_9LEPT|nr:hypothetical protein [Leptospira ilyithenensis]TGN13156.1 hypothetical protein EHS11_04465 [Leptospira ilyithenensis]